MPRRRARRQTVTTPASTGLPTLVQSASSSTTTVTLPGTSAPGDLLVLTAGVYTGATKPITAVSDGRNTWTKAGGYFVAGQNSDGELWYTANAAGVRTITVTTAGRSRYGCRSSPTWLPAPRSTGPSAPRRPRTRRTRAASPRRPATTWR